MDNHKSLFGIGLRREHYPYLIEKPNTDIDWFEVISENYMNTEGRPMSVLESIRIDYPIACHSVGMSLGSSKKIDSNYLFNLKRLIKRVDPFLVSDHLAWNDWNGTRLHELIPIPFHEESLEIIANNIDYVQNELQRKIAIENISAYFSYTSSTMNEAEFLKSLTEKTGCLILLDINNIYVNAKNFQFDPLDFIKTIPKNSIAQIHLAGFTDMGNFLFDTHAEPVHPEVWNLLEKSLDFLPKNIPMMIEWDENVPEFHTLQEELNKLRMITKSGNKNETKRTTEFVL
ncbi:DUF692 domain-containing protein [Leptospira sp. 2 VSF19]|uniref:DUF692 domain-containing protein n=1 Tax=Leptospira soteropolitanensis TaxID=2950025 RepID=A0AAW5VDP3_9LEPT|nr:DUF692 domain-containing protein [Leptospira soteropolitanensis]MCW7491674.1 DUF692 domain-containing protein [Leptospira soteropolitanensis]MCW7499258.1 DUF692 domain-containing protein [Leptospira soteropolitanensis]MCW7521150.1 DUF692 domain-containing protein [Leptospira soteropolitanensis]MCW7525362.1 DUF692 domain-containing protein [Leptospira soteropolitanensis]MCW7529229.1 DUF692 domain-containing protein [Leptospira soteropolitanensis]